MGTAHSKPLEWQSVLHYLLHYLIGRAQLGTATAIFNNLCNLIYHCLILLSIWCPRVRIFSLISMHFRGRIAHGKSVNRHIAAEEENIYIKICQQVSCDFLLALLLITIRKFNDGVRSAFNSLGWRDGTKKFANWVWALCYTELWQLFFQS